MRLLIGPHLKRKKMTQAALADRLNISRGYMSELVSGKKTPSVDLLSRIIDELGVEPGEVYGKQVSQTETAINTLGFHENSVEPFLIPNGGKRETLISSICPDIAAVETFVAKIDMPSLAIRKGDMIFTDVKRHPTSGDTVIATVADQQIGEAHTMAGLWLDPWFVPGNGSQNSVAVDKTGAVVVMGVVMGVVRKSGT